MRVEHFTMPRPHWSSLVANHASMRTFLCFEFASLRTFYDFFPGLLPHQLQSHIPVYDLIFCNNPRELGIYCGPAVYLARVIVQYIQGDIQPTVLLCVGCDVLCPGVLLVSVHGHLHAVHVGVLGLYQVGQQAAGVVELSAKLSQSQSWIGIFGKSVHPLEITIYGPDPRKNTEIGLFCTKNWSLDILLTILL